MKSRDFLEALLDQLKTAWEQNGILRDDRDSARELVKSLRREIADLTLQNRLPDFERAVAENVALGNWYRLVAPVLVHIPADKVPEPHARAILEATRIVETFGIPRS